MERNNKENQDFNINSEYDTLATNTFYSSYSIWRSRLLMMMILSFLNHILIKIGL